MDEDQIVDEDVLDEEEQEEETPAPIAETPADEIDWKARAEKAEALIVKNKKAPKAAPIKPTPDTTDEVPEWGKTILEAEAKRVFGHAKGLAPETVDKLYQFSGGQLTDELMEDVAAKGIVLAMESARKNAANTPKGGSTPTYKGKTYAETATDPEASDADKQAAFEAAAKRRGK